MINITDLNPRTAPTHTIRSNPQLEVYCVHLATGTRMRIYDLFDLNENYSQASSGFHVESIQRGDARSLSPHIICGTLEIDANRPGEDSSADMQNHNVIIEFKHWIPETIVYPYKHTT